MERSKSLISPDEPIRWVKLGGGSLRLGKRIIKPNETFTAKLSEIPVAFRDRIKAVDGGFIPIGKEAEKVVAPPPPIEAVKTEYTVEPKPGAPMWFNVVGPDGKVLNEKGLKKEAAEALVRSIMEK